MLWAPNIRNREAIKFWLACLQIVTVIAGVTTAAASFVYHSREERLRAIEQDRRAEEQLAAVRRELQRPYQEKKLNLYLDAARVLAHLAATPDVDREKTEARFWELYWGELAFVESRTIDENKGGPSPAVERLMVEFCQTYFQPLRCSRVTLAVVNEASMPERTSIYRAAVTEAAIKMARQASDEIRQQWETVRK